MTKQTPELSDELQKLVDRAAQVSEDPELFRAFNEAMHDPELWAEATREPGGFLRSRGIDLPEGLDITFLDDPFRGRPVPDFEFFTIRLFNCRKYWVKKRDGEPGFEEVEVCRGFEIVPNPVPGGPIG